MPWAMHLSRDATRFYVQSADQEHFEVIDVASRQTLDTFTLSEGNKHVRALAFDGRSAESLHGHRRARDEKLIDRFEIGAPTFTNTT